MQYLPTAVMLLSTFGWAFGNVGNKAALAYFDPFLLIALRFAASAVTLWLVLVVSGRLRRLRQVRPAQIFLGLVEPFTVGALLVLGVSMTSANHVVLLWALMPVASSILGQVVMKERPGSAVVAGAALAIAGSAVLVLGGPLTAGSLLGDALVILGVLIASFNQILVRRIAMGGADPTVTSTSQVSMSTVCAWLVVMTATPSQLSGLGAPVEAWLLVAALGVFGSALPFIAYNYALRTMPMGRSALFMPMIAPQGAVLAALWLGETLSLNVIVALLLTLTGVLLPSIVTLLPKRQAVLPRPETHDPSVFLAPAPELAEKNLAAIEYVVFDCETTGLRPSDGDRLVAIGAVRVREGRPLDEDRFERLINPGIKIPRASTRIHGIDDVMVADARRDDDVLREFRAYVGDAVLVAHNAAFDMKFLHLAEARAGVRFDRPVLDTLLMSAWLHPARKRHDLDGLLRDEGIAMAQRHSALADAAATAELFSRQIAALPPRGVETLGELVTRTRMVAELRANSRRF